MMVNMFTYDDVARHIRQPHFLGATYEVSMHFTYNASRLELGVEFWQYCQGKRYRPVVVFPFTYMNVPIVIIKNTL